MIFTNDKSIFSEKEEKFEIRGKIEIKTEPSIKTELIKKEDKKDEHEFLDDKKGLVLSDSKLPLLLNFKYYLKVGEIFII